VPRGLWDYFQSPEIASTYDDYFAHNSLFQFDEHLLLETFREPGLVVDLGSGTGRALVPLARAGHRGLAVDLSQPMLRIVRQKAAAENLPIDCLRTNLVQLDALRDAVADYAICMFSTLGMIRGRENREQVVRHAHRILKPGGRFVLHAHNVWFNLYDPGGPWWVLKSLFASAARKEVEFGDKFFPYRGIPSMFLHVFRRGELTGLLRRGGFRIERIVPLDVVRRHPLPRPWLFGRLRANGWIIVCQKGLGIRS
jgi:SAM-dependent methyltransferase